MFVKVLLDQNLDRPLDYRLPEGMQASIGMRVEVPLRKQTAKGVIIAITTQSNFSEAKPILRLLQEQTLSPALWTLAEWLSTYYATPFKKVLPLFFPPSIRKGINAKKKVLLELALPRDEAAALCPKQPEKQQLVIHHLLKTRAFLSELTQTLSISRAPIDALVEKKIIRAQLIENESDLLLDQEFFPTQPKPLNGEQQAALDAISFGSFAVHLLYGVTGSGKTEVYMQAIKRCLDMGKNAMVLVPEISLTSQTIERFKARFGIKIAVLHHKRSQGERSFAWQSLASGQTRLLIGARSALFAPLQNLGLVIIDEEHDSSYKQSEEAPCYQARDVAIMRAKLEQAVILLGSATPSLESMLNAQNGKYRLSKLTQRATNASIPKVTVVDLLQAYERAGGFTHFSDPLIQGMQERLEKGEQTLLLLNRRGYRRQQLCTNCRHIIQCPACDLPLTYHLNTNLLACHFCGHHTPPPLQCPSCHTAGSLQFKGFGTEHVERSLQNLLPSSRILRMDRDTTQGKHSHEQLFHQFRAHKADILIGTQMIAKGFHFPSVTLVGVLLADTSLTLPDFRAAENTFQLLTQVAGRSGRSDLKGEVILQTFLPDHPVLKLAALQDYDAFFQMEIGERKEFLYPPFCRLVKCLFSGPDEEITRNAAEAFRNHLRQGLPVSPAGHPKIKNLYRYQFLIKTHQIAPLSRLLLQLQTTVPQSVKFLFDIDPHSTYF